MQPQTLPSPAVNKLCKLRLRTLHINTCTSLSYPGTDPYIGRVQTVPRISSGTNSCHRPKTAEGDISLWQSMRLSDPRQPGSGGSASRGGGVETSKEAGKCTAGEEGQRDGQPLDPEADPLLPRANLPINQLPVCHPKWLRWLGGTAISGWARPFRPGC